MANEQRARNGGRAPRREIFGWSPDGSLNTTQAELIKRAYKTLLESEEPSLRGIYRDWNDKGHLTSTGGKWSHNAFRLMLLRPRNAGLSEYRGEIVGTGSWEAIVTPEDYETVRRMLTQPDRLNHAGTRTQHLLSYILVCSCGGKTIAGRRGHGTGVYRCIECSASIPRAVVHRKVLIELVDDLARPEIRRFFKTNESQESLARIDAVRADLLNLSKQVEELQSAGVPWEMLLDSGRKLQERRVSLEQELSVLLQGSALVRLLEGLYEPVGFNATTHAKKVEQLKESRKHIIQRFGELNLDQQRHVISGMYHLTLLPGNKRGGRVSYEDIAKRIQIDVRLESS